MPKDYGPSGVLHPNEYKKTANHPDYRGNITMDRELVQCLVDQLKDGNKYAEIEIAGWKKVSGAGKQFLSIAPSIPYRLTEKGKEREREKAEQGRFEPSPSFDEGNDLDDEIPF
jgi:uncharacterized protein (DUF736 family)